MKTTYERKKKTIESSGGILNILMYIGRGVLLQEHLMTLCRVFNICKTTKFKEHIGEMKRIGVVGNAECKGRQFIIAQHCVTDYYNFSRIRVTKSLLIRSYLLGEHILEEYQDCLWTQRELVDYIYYNTTISHAGSRDVVLANGALKIDAKVMNKFKRQGFIISDVVNTEKWETRPLRSGKHGYFIKNEYKDDDSERWRRLDIIYVDAFGKIDSIDSVHKLIKKLQDSMLYLRSAVGETYKREIDVVHLKILTLESGVKGYSNTYRGSGNAADIVLYVEPAKPMTSELNSRARAKLCLDNLFEDCETEEQREKRKAREREKSRRRYQKKKAKKAQEQAVG